MPSRLKSARKALFQLAGGSALAQAIPLMLSPILTRIYGPEDYGFLAILSSSAALIGVVAAGRYDLALIEPRDPSVARALLAGSTILTILVTSLIFAVTVGLVLGQPELFIGLEVSAFMLAAPAAACLAFYSILLAWLNRLGDFRGMAVARVINGAGNAGVALCLGLLGYVSGGLVAGLFAGLLVAIAYQWQRTRSDENLVSRAPLVATLKDYRRYPQYLIPGTAAGTIASEAPVFVFMRFFDSTVTGFFSLAVRTVSAPLSLVGNAIGEVYRKHAVDEFNTNGNCRTLFLKSLSALAIVGLVPWLVLFFYGPDLFALIFGESWRRAGEFCVYLSFMVYFQLLSTPLANTIILNQSQNKDMFLQIGRMVFGVAALVIGVIERNVELSLALYSFVFSCYYIAHSYLQYRAASGLK